MASSKNGDCEPSASPTGSASMESTGESSLLSTLSLHDCLSLGEVELGLHLSAQQQQSASASTTPSDASRDRIAALRKREILRLPKLLRLLSMTRTLAPLSILGSVPNDDSSSSTKDALVTRTVERLEHVAASHSVAEGVDVVTCHLTPTLTRKLSRVPSLQYDRPWSRATATIAGAEGTNSATDSTTTRSSKTSSSTAKRNSAAVRWDTAELAAVARSPRGSASRKRKRQTEAGTENKDDDAKEASIELDDESSEEGGEDMDVDEVVPPPKQRIRTDSIQRRESLDIAAEDSPEATVVKILSELTTLVVTSLEPIQSSMSSHHNGDDTAPTSLVPKKGQLSLTTDDSILAESAQDDGGVMGGSDLGSTVAAIMHHAPVLQCKHVAVRRLISRRVMGIQSVGSLTFVSPLLSRLPCAGLPFLKSVICWHG